MNEKRNNGMWKYLEDSGVLVNGSDADIQKKRKEYRKIYFKAAKRRQRAARKDFTISFGNDTGDFSRIEIAAKNHNVSITEFLRLAILAYLSKTFNVPDKKLIFELQILLSNCYNEIKTISSTRDKYHWERDSKIITIEKKIENLEMQINNIFQQPPELADFIDKTENIEPALKQQLLVLINSRQDDYKNINPPPAQLPSTP